VTVKLQKSPKNVSKQDYVEADSDPRTPRERLIYPYTVERHLDGWAIHKNGKYAGPGCDFYDRDEKLIPLLDCLNRENAKLYA